MVRLESKNKNFNFVPSFYILFNVHYIYVIQHYITLRYAAIVKHFLFLVLKLTYFSNFCDFFSDFSYVIYFSTKIK